MCFGCGARFPAKYREALFLCDWSYGRLYAAHLKPAGASYSADVEEFLSGAPLPLTDILVRPQDGALYFAIGGWKSASGLYRVVYVGDEPTTASGPDGPDAGAGARARRRALEAFHGRRDPAAVAMAWPCLSDPDRFIRFAARVPIEFQDPDSCRDRALAEAEPRAALEGLLALARVSAQDPAHRAPTGAAPDPALRGRILAALDRLDWPALAHEERLDLLRVYQVVLNRMGRPDDATASRLVARLDPLYPAEGRELNVELCNLLVYLGAPDVAAKTLALMAKAPTQEEPIDYARALRALRRGWTPDRRRSFFSWMAERAAGFRGGPASPGS